MQVILLERVENLGQMGDVVTVKPGYARNYLLPQKKALRATEENRTRFESDRAQLEAKNLERKSEAESVAAKVDGVSVVLIRAASESGQLYGSVNARDIAVGLTEAGCTVSRDQVLMERPVKTLGIFEFRIRLHPEVSATISVNVAKSPEEADAQADRVARGLPALQTLAELEAEQDQAERRPRQEASETEAPAEGDAPSAADAPADDAAAAAPEGETEKAETEA